MLPLAKILHCVRNACILRTHRLGYSPKNTCHLFTSKAKQQSPHQNNKTAFSLVIKCPYEQANQPYKVQLCKGMQDAHMFKWQVPHSDISPGQGHARCTHVQVASATLGYITRTVATQLATNTVIIFFLYNGCLLLRPYRLWHMRPRSIGLIPSLSVNAKLSKVVQNTHMAMQLRCRACPDIADIPPLPQPCKEVLHPCTIETMDIIRGSLCTARALRATFRLCSPRRAPKHTPWKRP